KVSAPICRRLEELQAEIDPNWLAWVERVARYSVFWSEQQCRLYASLDEVGRPLQYLVGRYSTLNSFKVRGIRAGDYVYPIRVNNRRLYVLARMRVREIAPPEVLPPVRPSGRRLSEACLATSAREVVIGDHGTCLGFYKALPSEAVTRLRFRARHQKERALRHLRNGELLHSVELQGIFQLTQRTVMDFERLLAGLPFPDLPPEEANLFA